MPVAVLHLAELVPYALLLWLLLSTWGILGAAVAWTVRVAVDAMLLLVLSGAATRDYGRLIIPLTMLLSSTMMVLHLPPSSPLRWSLFVFFFGAIALWVGRRIPSTMQLVAVVPANSLKP